MEDFLPALVRCQGLSHQLRQLESAVEASAVAQRRLEEHVEAAAVAADAADACLGSGDAPEGESAAELEALGYESRVGRGAVLQATQAARRECVRMTSTIETEVLKRLDGSALPAQPRKGAATPGERKAQKDFFSCHASAERALDQEAMLRKLRQNSRLGVGTAPLRRMRAQRASMGGRNRPSRPSASPCEIFVNLVSQNVTISVTSQKSVPLLIQTSSGPRRRRLRASSPKLPSLGLSTPA